MLFMQGGIDGTTNLDKRKVYTEQKLKMEALLNQP